MTAWPDLTRTPSPGDFEEELEDPAFKTPIEGGYVATRPRHTRTPRETWRFRLPDCPKSDRDLLKAHWKTVRGCSAAFTWTHPIDGTVHNVRFMEKPKYQPVSPGDSYRFDITNIVLEEV